MKKEFVYKDHYVSISFPQGFYVALTPKGYVKADTKIGIKKLIDKSLK